MTKTRPESREKKKELSALDMARSSYDKTPRSLPKGMLILVINKYFVNIWHNNCQMYKGRSIAWRIDRKNPRKRYRKQRKIYRLCPKSSTVNETFSPKKIHKKFCRKRRKQNLLEFWNKHEFIIIDQNYSIRLGRKKLCYHVVTSHNIPIILNLILETKNQE